MAAGLNNISVFLNTVNQNVRSNRDLTDTDKIALPSVKVSLKAMVLGMQRGRAVEHLAMGERRPI